MSDRIFNTAVIGFAILTMIIGLGSLLSQLNRDLFWYNAFNGFQDIGENCGYRISHSPDIRTDLKGDLTPIRVPFRKDGKFPAPAEGQFLHTVCKVDNIDRTANFVWIYLGPIFGDAKVYVDDRHVVNGTGRSELEFPLNEEEIKRGEVHIAIVSDGRSSIKPVGPATLIPPIIGYDKSKIDALNGSLGIWRTEIPAFGIGFSVAISILFAIAWLFGIRYADVGWIIILNSSVCIMFALEYEPLDRLYSLVSMQAKGVTQMVIVSAIYGFLSTFFREQKRLHAGLVFLSIVIMYSAVILMTSPENFLAYKLQARTPILIGIALMLIAGGFSAYDLWRKEMVIHRYNRRVIVTVMTFAICAMFICQVYLEDVVGINLTNYMFYAVVSVFSGITAYDIAIYRNRMLQEQYENQTNKAIARTAQMVSHDLRRPMKVLGTIIEDLDRHANPELVIKNLQAHIPDIAIAMDDIRFMLEDVTEIGSKREPCHECLYLPGLLADCSKTVRIAKGIPEKGAIIESPEDAYALGDRIKLTRLFTNLIANAFEASPAGKAIQILVEQVDRSWQCSVTNWGDQIPADKISRLFEPFYTSNKPTGTGLGLAIVDKVAKEHRTKVAVRSTDKGKTTFSLKLPATEPAMGAIDKGSDTKVRIIIVDDDPFCAEIWKKSFPDYGFHQHFDAGDFVRSLKSNHIDLTEYNCAIVDYFFENSVLTGLDVVRALKGYQPQLPVFVASYNPDALPSELHKLADRVFPKEPLSWAELRQKQ